MVLGDGQRANAGLASLSFTTTVPAGSQANPFVTATATDPGGNTSEFSNDVQSTASATADLSVIGTGFPKSSTVGSSVTYALTVSNGEGGRASGVILTDVLPAGVSFVSAESSQGTASLAGGTVTANLGPLANGATATIKIVVTLTAPGAISDRASVGGDQTDPDKDNNAIEILVNATLAAPANLTAVADGTAIDLEWAAIPGALAYNVYRSTVGGKETLYQPAVPASIGSAVNFRDATIQLGQIYYYQVTAVAGSVESARSNEASATVPVPNPVTPIHVFASLRDTGKGTFAPFVTWGLPVGSTGSPSFLIYRSKSSGGEGSVVYTSVASAHDLVDSVGKPGTTYYYQVAELIGGVAG